MPRPSIVPNPHVLQQAVDRYLALAADGDIAADVPLQNAAYTLCVLTGTRTVEEAMAAVELLCSGAPSIGNASGERELV
ncbi:DUF5133 domain-containing protein [Streptomyces sp. NPDC005492]|uniref:DUF5133 domain-containing protein n=1 Tax=Streptomyces sp. NPDC005492 TaxID=3156883 RepID=UPI0033B8F81C